MSLKYLESDDDYDDEIPECPLCTEILESDDLNFKPCPCGYQVIFFFFFFFFKKQLDLYLVLA